MELFLFFVNLILLKVDLHVENKLLTGCNGLCCRQLTLFMLRRPTIISSMRYGEMKNDLQSPHLALC